MALRALTRLAGSLLMLALALLGLGIALYCFDGFISLGSTRPDKLLGLSGVRRHVGHFLDQLAAPGHTAALALLCGLGAMLLGLVLLYGTLRPSRQRLAVLERDAAGGRLAARPSTIRAMVAALAGQAPGATGIKRPKVGLSRRGGRGRIKVSASRSRTTDPRALQRAVTDQLEPISGPFNLRPHVRVQVGERRERVQ